MRIPGESVLTISDLETLRVISDPLRLKIYRKIATYNLAGEFCTVKQISDELEMPPAKLYYHFKLLESHGLVEVADTRMVSGIVEKRYRVPAIRISIADELLEGEGEPNTLYPMFAEMMSEILEDIRLVLRNSKAEKIIRNFTLSQHTLYLPQNKINLVTDKVERLLREIESELPAEAGEELVPFSFFFSCYPKLNRVTPARQTPSSPSEKETGA